MKTTDNNSDSTLASTSDDTTEKNKKKQAEPVASLSDVFSFGNTRRVMILRMIGLLFACGSGAIYPAMAFYFAKIFQDLSAPMVGDEYMENLTDMVYVFLVLGALGFVLMVIQSTCLELAATESTTDLKIKWFNALLRQDMAYYDIKDVSAQATIVSAYAAKYKKGTGKKLGDGIQFTATAIGGLIYAFTASWRTSLIILAVVPFMALSSSFMMNVTTKQTARKSKNYRETGGIVHATLSSIRTVFSLNACQKFLTQFEDATERACKEASAKGFLVGLGAGGMMASFILSYVVLTLYGASLLYKQVKEAGCDPSGAVVTNEDCDVTGMDVFGALMGVSFGAMGLTQVGAAIEALTGARGACYPALVAIRRRVGEEEAITKKGKETNKTVDIESGKEATTNNDDEMRDRKDIPLPKYVIDSSSTAGKKPTSAEAEIEFHDVSFSYPTRPGAKVFDKLSLKIVSGQTVAVVGPSGGGKSTIVQLLERFYDPTSGFITFDGTDLKDLNVQWLRDQIGLVSQEPTLFARSIRENIAYGCPGATMEQIIEVAKAANAHGFIETFPNGYDTQVGDKGAQISGGQKQRIAIARILLKNPKLLLLDEATSALDSESEYVVQKALDNLLGAGNRTTIVIAHRLSTIRNADMIAVVKEGTIVETGTHDELLSREGSEYGKLIAAQQGGGDDGTVSRSTSVASDLDKGGISQSTSVASDLDKAENLDAMEDNTEGTTTTRGEDQLVFKDVSFSYPTRPDVKIFKHLNLSVKQGETLALVGPSGGGKSTVIQLIERFYDPTSGSITLDNINLKDMNVKYLRDQVGLVSQEPTLFNTNIRENIRLGLPSATQDDIEKAAKQANAHDFIMGFPRGYDTEVGENATQISGGQKQRIAIARAILKKPKILLLDEATSALDSESERIVQEAIDKVMQSNTQTVVVIAHRLSTIRNADRIAVIAKGSVQEIGTHDYLMSLPKGRYRRLQEIQYGDDNNKNKTNDASIKSSVHSSVASTIYEEEEEKEEKAIEEISKEDEKRYVAQARSYAVQDIPLLIVGAIGAIFAGLVFPGWGIVFAYMIELLYRPVFKCNDDFLAATGYPTCQDYWNDEYDYLRNFSFKITAGWIVLMISTLVGNVLLVHGFGSAVERMNKRVRDAVFRALMRQDVAYYDAHTVGNLSTKIEDDAAMIHSFSGEPVRAFTMSAASVLVGLVISFIFMWPFALLTLAIMPFMSFGAYIEMKMHLGEDDKTEATTNTTKELSKQQDNDNGKTTPGAIVVETLLNIRTVASLSIEKLRAIEYRNALAYENPSALKTNLLKGSAVGIGFLIQQWGMGLMFWWGGWVMTNYPASFDFRDYLISMFGLLFSISGMSVAMQDLTDQGKAKKAVVRIFALIEKECLIDSLSEEGYKGGAVVAAVGDDNGV